MKHLFAVLVCTMTPALAFAQTLPAAGEAMDRVPQSTAAPTEYEFLPEDVEGATLRPNDLGVIGEHHGKTSTLIRVRGDFVPEMMKSVENL